MFARSNFVQNSLSKVREVEKTDEELLAAWALENTVDTHTVEEEFGDKGLWFYYGKLAFFCRLFTRGSWENYFTSCIVVAIVLAGVLVGIDTYDELRENEIFGVLENIVLGIFVFECAAKLIAEGKTPLKFFTGSEGSWNTFDFIVVVFCMPFFSEIFGKNSPAIRIVSRLFRLFRVAKIVHQIPALQVIVKGLVGGLKSIVYVATLLVLVFYLYGIIGVYVFKENDPFFFGNVPTALLTLFRVCTLENWGENMYINMYGCKDFDGGMYMTEEDLSAADWIRLQDMYKCTSPMPQPGVSALFFISFTVVSSLVMLSLFIGVITMSMQESLNDMRREVEESNRRKRLLKAEEEMAAVISKNKQMEDARVMAATSQRMSMMISSKDSSELLSQLQNRETLELVNDDISGEGSFEDMSGLMNLHNRCLYWLRGSWCLVFLLGPQGRGKKLSNSERKQMRDMAEMKALMMQAWHGTKASIDYHHKLDIDQEGSLEKYVRHLGLWSRKIIETAKFQNFITLVIVITAVTVGVETDYSNSRNEWIFNVIEKVIFGIFATEVVLRFLADDCVMKEYFSNGWNTFDFFVVAMSNIPGGGTVIVMLRLVRLLRVLKLVKSLPQLQVIVNALLMGLSSIGYIGIIMVLTFYLFAIMGIILFKDNDKFNFGTLHQAIVALFKVATLDNWGDVLYINFYGCDVYPPFFSGSVNCPSPKGQGGISAAFFALFVVVGSLVMITLFVGVVTTSMEEATRLQLVEMAIETRIMTLCHERSVTSSQLDIYRRVFSMLDLDGGGTIEGEELKSGLSAVNIECSDEQLEIWVKEVDENSDGVIDLIEFIIFMTNMKKKAVEEQERKLERKGADAFLRLRKKAIERRLPDPGGGKVVPISGGRARADSQDKDDTGSHKGIMGSLRRTGSSFFRGKSDKSDKSDAEKDSPNPTPAKPSFLKRAGSALFGGSRDDILQKEVKGVFEDKPATATTVREQIFGRDTSQDVQKYAPAEDESDEDEFAGLRRTGASFFKKDDEKK